MWLFHLSDEQRSRPPAKALPVLLRSANRNDRRGPISDGFDALARTTLLRALRMRYGHSMRRASRLRSNASETRLMGNAKVGSKPLAPRQSTSHLH